MATDNDVVDTIQLKPDARLVKSLGAHHTLESAIADLVDNCLDAGADRISIRLLTKDDSLVQVEVVDNGKGMGPSAIDKAMTLGHRRDYGADDLGHFGVGMKAASFSHSDVLTVWSSTIDEAPVGRRIRRADFSKDFSCERLSNRATAAARRRRKEVVGSTHGSTVVWTSIRATYRGANADEARTWMANVERDLRSHLGVTFHRLIEKNALTIDILVDELAYAEEAIGTPVKPIDPFGYANTGRPGYPKKITAKSGTQSFELTCHIWPPKTDIPGFRILGKSGDSFQGFYVYRADRLLQVGGWSDVANRSPQRQLARVVLDDAKAIGTFLTMNSEKSGLRFEPIFKDALSHATARDGTTFDDFLADAEATYADGNRRTRKRQPVITPDRGFAPGLRRAVKNELPLKRSDSLTVQWKRLPTGEFIDVDFGNKILWLNQRYRHLLSPGGGSLNDAPLVKALLFLLTHHVFEGAHLGPKDKDNIALWRAVLGAAIEVEATMRSSND
ncbi:ATP-binding protein [Rhodococcus sp. D2-41]|uniref:ATP-binding protein n=1 Tax=Speluncibacter jeojiensis TaxID=2710754 RepID=UPI00240EF7F5|nr:ATP-binding protein [Rhodococcus sp. D2-41]MDG3012627.1 ATP-binding protein [Rhodococcus sp. D2-41]